MDDLIFIATILLITTVSGGLLAYLIKFQAANLRLPLVFAGSFLFAVTIIHILPEIFTVSEAPMQIGIWVLLGFFLQQLLETFTSGVEHGHFHEDQVTTQKSRYSLLIALMIHSLLEGALLTHESPFHDQHESYSLILGIVFHKMPAAFALMAAVRTSGKIAARDLVILLLFSLASPIGLVFSNYILTISEDNLLVLFALVSGNFLHISTTIFVETSPNHNLGWRRTLASAIGATMAILVEFFS